MNQKLLKQIAALVIVLMIAGCSSSAPTARPVSPTQTPPPPTATPVPATATPIPPTVIPYSEFVELDTIQGPAGNAIASLALSPDGTTLAYGSYADDIIHVVDVASGEETLTLEGHTTPVTALAFSPNGSFLASTGTVNLPPEKDGSVRIWDAKSGKELAAFDTLGTNFLAFNPDSTILAGAGGAANSMQIRLWSLETFSEKTGLKGIFSHFAFSPDGKLIASKGMRDPVLHVLEVETGKEVLSLSGPESWVQIMAFSPDGSRLASGGDDAILYLWDAQTGEMLRSLTGHASEPKFLAFGPDSTVIASLGSGSKLQRSGNNISLSFISGDGVIRFWDVETGNQTGTIEAAEEISAVSFSADWAVIATGTEQGAIQIWMMKK